MRISPAARPYPATSYFPKSSRHGVHSASVQFGGRKRNLEEEEPEKTRPTKQTKLDDIGSEPFSAFLASQQLLNMANTIDGTTPLMRSAQHGYIDNINRILAATTGSELLNRQNQAGKTALHYAVAFRQYGAVETLLARGARRDIPDQDSQTPITLAASLGDIRSLALLCKNDADVNPAKLLGQGKFKFPLTRAVKHNQPAAVAFLLQHGAHPDGESAYVRGYQGKSPLMVATAHNNTPLIRTLLASGAEPDMKNAYGTTALSLAAARNHWEAIQVLMEHDANPASALNELQDLMLSAAKNEDVEKLGYLLQQGIPVLSDTRQKRKVYHAALLGAAATNNIKLARLLLRHGVEPDADFTEKSALVAAAEHGNEAIVRLLLAHGADIDQQWLAADDGDAQTALHKAVQRNDIGLTRYLLAQGAGLEIVDTEGRTALTHAIQAGHNSLAKLLHEHYGAETEWDFEEDQIETTPVIAAAATGNLEMLDFLIQTGAGADTANADKETPLMYAKNRETALKLLRANATLEAMDAAETRPLMHHASRNNTGVMELLLSEGADINAMDDSRKSALLHAVDHNHPEAVELLLRHNAQVNELDAEDDNALTTAVKSHSRDPDKGEAKRRRILESLLRRGANVRHFNGDFENALMIAAKRLLPASTAILLQYGAPTRSEGEEFPSALSLAATACLDERYLSEDAVAVLKLLVQAYPDDARENIILQELVRKKVSQTVKALVNGSLNGEPPEKPGSKWQKRFHELRQLIDIGISPQMALPGIQGILIGAAKLGEAEKVEFLLKSGVPVDGLLDTPETALMQASQFGQTEVADILLEYGANPNYMSSDGKNPFQLATRRGCLNTMLRLLQAGADPAPHIQTADETADMDIETHRKSMSFSWPLKLSNPDVAGYLNNLLGRDNHGKTTWNLKTRNRQWEQAQHNSRNRHDAYPVVSSGQPSSMPCFSF